MLGGFAFGVGIAFAFASAADLVVEAVKRSEVGVATGINTVLRRSSQKPCNDRAEPEMAQTPADRAVGWENGGASGLPRRPRSA
jgi:hypothetical protein